MCISSRQNIFQVALVYTLESTPDKLHHSGYSNNIYPVTLMMNPRCLITQSTKAPYDNLRTEETQQLEAQSSPCEMRESSAEL